MEWNRSKTEKSAILDSCGLIYSVKNTKKVAAAVTYILEQVPTISVLYKINLEKQQKVEVEMKLEKVLGKPGKSKGKGAKITAKIM